MRYSTKFQGMITPKEFYMEKSSISVIHFPKNSKRRVMFLISEVFKLLFPSLY